MDRDGADRRSPITSWTGWDVRGGASNQDHAAETFVRSVTPQSGPETNYELIAVAARGFRPTRFLSAVDHSDEDGLATPDATAPTAAVEREAFRQTWSLLYRRITETAPTAMVPYAIYLLGVNPPEGATEEELEVFNAFYTDVHLREVAERRHALRALRYELVRAVRPPYQGAPQFLAVYEVDEAGASSRRHVGPPYSKGPEVWQRHTTPWRLWYRLLAAEGDQP